MAYGHLFPWQILTRSFGLAMAHRFDRQYDVAKLQAECRAILEQFHPNNQHGKDHDGGWKAVSLVAPGGNAFEDRIHGNQFAKTPALELAPYMEEIIDSFPSKPRRVRLMQLLPGENIYWHYDPDESLDRKHIRLHVPVFTHDRIQFQIGHEDCRWQAGDLWYGDFTFPHRLYNAGDSQRVHLVMDFESNSDIKSIFPETFLQGVTRRHKVRKWCQRANRVYNARRYGYVEFASRRFVINGRGRATG